MDRHKMKVFHGLVNYGTQSGFHARELRELGIDAKSVTQYDKFERVTDLTLKHSGKNLVHKLYNYIWNQIYLVYCFFRYNIFHFYAGKSLTKSQWDLPLYKFFGKKIVFEYLGIDVQKYKYCVENFKYTNIIYLVDEEHAEEHDRNIEKKLNWHGKYADLQLVCAPCYSPYVSGSKVLPLGIDLDEYTYTPMPERNGKLKIMHAPTHRGNKGTEFIIDAIDRLIDNDYAVEKMLVENVSHSRLKELYRECDIFVDQIMGGWYGTASIEAMALRRPVVCSIYEEFCEYADYTEGMPIIHADPDSIYDVLKQLVVKDRRELEKIGAESRSFVEKVHDISKTTDLLLEIYTKL
jgi:glycosyltransferase involved in cell wall biosynthesis